MKVYRTKKGIVIEKSNHFYTLPDEDWDAFINDDNLYNKVNHIIQSSEMVYWLLLTIKKYGPVE